MDEANRNPANPLWDFSGTLYAQPAVAQACLRLQDRDGLDVNLLLFCVWAAASGLGRLGEAEIARAMAALVPVRTRAIDPLRALRRKLKAKAAEASSAAIEALRRDVAAAELNAERIGQDILVEIVTREAVVKPNAADARENLAAYLDLSGVRVSPSISADLDVLLAAAFPVV